MLTTFLNPALGRVTLDFVLTKVFEFVLFALVYLFTKVCFDTLDYVFNADLLASYRLVLIFYLDAVLTNFFSSKFPTVILGFNVLLNLFGEGEKSFGDTDLLGLRFAYILYSKNFLV